MPAPKGNINAVKSGNRIQGIIRLTLGELPGTMRRQLSSARKYRRDLENAVVAVKGEVNLNDAHLIDLATNAETHASVCRWLMRERLDKMSTNDVLACSREILKAKEARNRAFAKLNLDADQENIINALYHIEATQDSPRDDHNAAGRKSRASDDEDEN